MLYKLFRQPLQFLGLVRHPESRNRVRLLFWAMDYRKPIDAPNPLASSEVLSRALSHITLWRPDLFQCSGAVGVGLLHRPERPRRLCDRGPPEGFLVEDLPEVGSATRGSRPHDEAIAQAMLRRLYRRVEGRCHPIKVATRIRASSDP